MKLTINPITKKLDLYLGSNPKFNSIEYIDSYFDDIRFPFTGQRIDISAGRIDYNFSEGGVEFQDNTRYPEEVISLICQLHHSWKTGTSIYPHLHYIQNQNQIPNWLLEYRYYENGSIVPSSWTQLIGENVFTYSSDSILQIYNFPSITLTSLIELSPIIDFRFYRDTNNASGLFSGSDLYTGNALSKEFDIHFEIDSPRSKEEYTK